jgi:two-component system cell cycle response regulator
MQILVLESKQQHRKISETLSGIEQTSGIEQMIVVSTLHEGKNCLSADFAQKIDILIVSERLDDSSGIEFCAALHKTNDKNHILGVYPPAILLISDEKEIDNHDRQALIQQGISAIFPREYPALLTQYLNRLYEKQNRAKEDLYKILLIEDSKAMRHHAKQCLSLLNAEIFCCDNAEEALYQLHTQDFDLIVTSLVLKGKLSGKSLIKTVRYIDGLKSNIPILVVSSSEDNSKKIDLLQIGASDFIHKPFIPQEFITRARNLIQNKKLLNQTEAQARKLQEMALVDHLTKLYNRHYLMEIAPKKITECIRHNIPCTVLVLDLDHFKSINDRFGHAKGDVILQESARAIKALCRENDIVARFGGEEFIVLFSHCGIEDGIQKAEMIRKSIEALRPDNIPISVSIGASQLSENCRDFTSLFQKADEMVYVAKENGRNQVRY